MPSPRARLRHLLQTTAIKHGSFVLSSGKTSSYYLDARLVTLDAEGAWLTGRVLLETLADVQVDAIGGPTMAADPIVAATIVVSHDEGRPLKGFLVRGEAKDHGRLRQIEGPLEPGMRVAIVDDTLTTGGSLLRAARAAEAAGCTVACVVALVDRLEGGTEAIRDAGYDLRFVYTVRELGVENV